ncbi:MAG: ATP-binding protein [Myxococcota bacterium]|jgi:two-component system sensor histidine kinase QseC
MNSLRSRLFMLVAAVTVFVWSGAALWTGLSTRTEIEQVLDRRLVEAARMVASLDMPAAGSPAEAIPTPYSRQLSCQIWSLQGELLGRSAGAPGEALASGAGGFSQRVIDDQEWRVFTHIEVARGIRVMVGDNLAVRNRLVSDLMLGLLFPAIAGLFALAILLWISIGRGLSPLNRLAAAIEARSPEELRPLAIDQGPTELRPVVEAMDALLARLAALRAVERDFVANAAHELQTPLAGLKTQAEVALRAVDPGMRTKALDRIIMSVNRTSRLVRQLLELARQQSSPVGTSAPMTSLGSVLDEIKAEFGTLAESRIASLTVDPTLYAVDLAIEPGALRLAIGNLVENAIIHSPAGTSISIGWNGNPDNFELLIEDDGLGIKPDEVERLRGRFERGQGTTVPGSGLGLSIVDSALRAGGATLQLRSRVPKGLIAAIEFGHRSVWLHRSSNGVTDGHK